MQLPLAGSPPWGPLLFMHMIYFTGIRPMEHRYCWQDFEPELRPCANSGWAPTRDDWDSADGTLAICVQVSPSIQVWLYALASCTVGMGDAL